MNSEMPIHVSSLLLSSLFIRLEPSTALRTRGSEFIIKSGEQSRPESIQVSLRNHTCNTFTYGILSMAALIPEFTGAFCAAAAFADAKMLAMLAGMNEGGAGGGGTGVEAGVDNNPAIRS